MKAKTSKKKPRLVHLFKKGDMNGLKENIQENFTTRMNNMEENTVEENWTYFKKIILQATKEFIPQKTIGSKQHVPWISTHIKRLIRRRQRRYNAAKKHNTKKNWNNRLCMFYKATHGKAAVNIPSYVRRPSTSTRQYHPEKFTQISTSTDAYKYSYIPRTITDWNSLPPEAFQATSLECFKEQLRRLQL
ncbi:Hypothetical predicted protein [Mytilus galloprovincialis]|uniref:Uncharacterized protein n=1 Tax=Mytilus galloprovincialis TaxID=29158 RepID=A0A8B6F134_MYTGA|nr:Hypothetical predicted protein [Mytilus galloprovincialis]